MTTTTHTAALGVFAATLAAGIMRKPGALGVVMGILAGMLFVPGFASAGESSGCRGCNAHVPEAPPNLRAEVAPGSEHNAIIVSWDKAHHHGTAGGNPNVGYWVSLSPFHVRSSTK